MKTVLTIAGVDPFGGAGMPADLKTITAHHVYAMSAITLLSVQNTKGFYEAINVDCDFLEKQIDCLFDDVIPDATKTGMLLSSEIINTVAKKIKQYKPKNLIIDPVMISHREIKLIDDNAINTMINALVPLADIITPNRGETEIISNMKIETKEDMLTAAETIFKKYHVNVLTKNDLDGKDSDDLLFTSQGPIWLRGEKIDTKNVRGTGDALSAALASNLAKGYNLVDSAQKAKRYVTAGLKAGIQIGHGKGPIDNMVGIGGEY